MASEAKKEPKPAKPAAAKKTTAARKPAARKTATAAAYYDNPLTGSGALLACLRAVRELSADERPAGAALEPVPARFIDAFQRLRADAFVLAMGSFSPLLAQPLGNTGTSTKGSALTTGTSNNDSMLGSMPHR